ncbi:MAG: hypothetical protein EOO38_10490 [Cytophagaceae bacterium]|nr:MAG: hypothetical protein EOO38_10490 [Cytophagaceae bacterium]
MSKLLATASLSTSAILLAACGGSDNPSTNQPGNGATAPVTNPVATYLPAQGEQDGGCGQAGCRKKFTHVYLGSLFL